MQHIGEYSVILRRFAVVVALIAGSFLVIGCAQDPRPFSDPRPLPSEAQRAAFGAMAIAADRTADVQVPTAPASMSGTEKAGATAATGLGAAGVGALAGLGCGPFAPICVPVFAASFGVAGLVGGAAGTIGYRSPEEINSADIALRNALFAAEIERRLVRQVVAQTDQATRRRLALVDHPAILSAWLDSDGRPIESLLLLRIASLTLSQIGSRQERNPDLRLDMRIEARILRSGREAPAFERRWHRYSKTHDYFEWAENDGALVSNEIEAAVSELAGQIVLDIFGATPQSIMAGTIAPQPQVAKGRGSDSTNNGQHTASGSTPERPVNLDGAYRATIPANVIDGNGRFEMQIDVLGNQISGYGSGPIVLGPLQCRAVGSMSVVGEALIDVDCGKQSFTGYGVQTIRMRGRFAPDLNGRVVGRTDFTTSSGRTGGMTWSQVARP